MQNLNQSPQKLGLLVGLGMISVFGIYYFTNRNNNNAQDIILTGSVNNKINQLQKVKEKLKKGQIEEDQFYSNIYRTSIQLSYPQIKKQNLKSRNRRRKLFNDKKLFGEEVIEFQRSKQLISEKYLHFVLAKIKILKRQLQSVYVDLQSLKIQVQKQQRLITFKNLKVVEVDEFKRIQQFMMKTLINCKEQKLGQQLQQYVTKFILYQIYLRDKVFQQFKYEHQEIQYSKSLLSQQQQIRIQCDKQLIQGTIQNLIYGEQEQVYASSSQLSFAQQTQRDYSNYS